MSGAINPTVVAVPNAVDTSTNLLALIAALTGVPTDYNQGSLVRTQSDATGLVIEQQGITAQARALQSITFGAMALFGITQSPGIAATGIVTFATAFPTGSAPLATQAVGIPSGSLVATNGGVQFSTLVGATLASGTTSISVGVQATTVGNAGNVPPLSINGLPLSSLGYPIFVQNAAAMSGGAPADTPADALARFTAKVKTLGLASPIAVANAPIGVTVSGETVRFAACYEPWVAAGSGAGSGTAGFIVYIDNGTGAASANLLAATIAWLNGNSSTGESGYRPAGVPYQVLPVVPVYANVVVSGTIFPGIVPAPTIASAVGASIAGYFNTLGFEISAEQAKIAADAANAGFGLFSSLTVSLFYSGSGTAVSAVSGGPSNRVILSSLVVDVQTENT